MTTKTGKAPAKKRARRAKKTTAQASAPRKTATRKSTARTAASRAKPAVAAGTAMACSLAKGAGAILCTTGKAAGAWLGWALKQPDIQRGLSFGVVTAALLLGSSAVKAEVERWPDFRIDRTTLDVGTLPSELSQAARRDLERLPLPIDPHAFDHRLVPAVHACLADLPWVEHVDQVRLAKGGKLAFSLRARRPVARLGVNSKTVVTADGAVIPAAYAANRRELPQLLHVPSAKRPIARQRAIEAAVAVLESLAGVELPIASIDLANLGGKDPLASEITLTTTGGTVIEWGRRPQDARPHLDSETKRDNLDRFLQRGPSFDACERVSLRWDEVTFVPRPVVEDEIARR